MELVREKWNKEDILEFQIFLKSLEQPSKIDRAKTILKTDLPVLGMSNNDMREIAKEISKGNYLSFLEHMIWEYYENSAINGFLISKIKDFDTFKNYLDIYSSKADNWATCDLLTFKIKGKEDNFIDIVSEYIKSNLPFRRRIGMFILFYFIGDPLVFDILDTFQDEENYYVNMMNSWLLCECFIKDRDNTLEYIKRNKLNKFTINKGIQKCRESRRVSIEDKELLLKYKKTM